MRKGIKILGKVISAIVLLLIFLPIIATLVLNVESVQNVLVKRASQYATAYLGTDVYVDGIDFDLFSKVHVRGFYVEDYNQDTLLYVAHATANIDGWNIAKDGLRLSNTKAYDAKFYLRELPSGQMNITPIVEQLQNGEKDGDFKLYIEDIDAEKLAYIILRLRSLRLRFQTRTSVAVHPAAYEIHGCHGKLYECSGNGAVVNPEIGLGLITEHDDCSLGTGQKSRTIVTHERQSIKSVPVLDYHECRAVTVPRRRRSLGNAHNRIKYFSFHRLVGIFPDTIPLFDYFQKIHFICPPLSNDAFHVPSEPWLHRS